MENATQENEHNWASEISIVSGRVNCLGATLGFVDPDIRNGGLNTRLEFIRMLDFLDLLEEPEPIDDSAEGDELPIEVIKSIEGDIEL
jgi:hypothetical protein